MWRNGRCLELVPDPQGRAVDPGSQTDITVTIVHKAHDDEIERPVRATLAGTEKVDPLDSPVMAPADFTYTATSESEGEGTVTFRSESNRGIAEKVETYTVEQRLLLDLEGTSTLELGAMVYRGNVKGRGLRVKLVPGASSGDPAGVTVEGDVEMRGRIERTARPAPMSRPLSHVRGGGRERRRQRLPDRRRRRSTTRRQPGARHARRHA